MQTIIGSGGGIGIPLARELKNFSDRIRLVSRNPVKVNDTDELFPADVTGSSAVEMAVAGSEVVYVTVGFEYNLKVWQRTWPSFMQEVINACKKHNSRLLFFDNVYSYDKSAISFMTEESLINPPSKKGEVRKILYEMIMNEIRDHNLNALIARAADFYGPENKSSALTIMVAENLIKGKKAQAMGDINKIHTYTYTPDAAKATAILGNTPEAFNQVWHLPTTKEKLKTVDWMELVAKELGKELKIQKIPAWMLHLMGVFVPVLREFPEMLYQYDSDYVFDSSKFEKHFGLTPTSPEEGIRRTIESLKNLNRAL